MIEIKLRSIAGKGIVSYFNHYNVNDVAVAITVLKEGYFTVWKE